MLPGIGAGRKPILEEWRAMAFNPSQEEAVSHIDGPMMVLAGPGSGKTTVDRKSVV